jgi:hypothetical protein
MSNRLGMVPELSRLLLIFISANIPCLGPGAANLFFFLKKGEKYAIRDTNMSA